MEGKKHKKLRKNRIFSHMMLMIGILCFMMSENAYNSYAKSQISKRKPVGVMATAVHKRIAVSWEPVTGVVGYEVFEAGDGEETLIYRKVRETRKCKVVLKKKKPGGVYHYYIRGYQVTKTGKRIYSKNSKKVVTTVAENGTSTVKNLLQTALAPVGSTMYVWGGGWNKADTAAGTEAKRVGLSPSWRTFAKGKTSSYDYRNYRYRIHNGLDCSGYIGWCVYNVLNTQDRKKGYVYPASKQAKKYADFDFGTYREPGKVKDYRAGDIMSSATHVWMVVGECADGSVVLLHASPSGVQLNGTTTPSGKVESQAYRLAVRYMKKYYKSWYQKYPNVSRGTSYLSGYGQMRWNTSGSKVVLSDPDGYCEMEPEEILQDLFGEIE